MATSTAIAGGIDEAVPPRALRSVPLAPIEPAALSRFLAVAAVLGERAKQIHSLSPGELRMMIAKLARVSFPDALAIARAATE
jgi:hypothetical protein